MAPNSVRSVDVAGANTVPSTTASAGSIAELISTIPQTWRSAASPILLNYYRVAGKLCNVQNTIHQYERHAAEGSFPGSISNSIKEPSLQFSKEFLGTQDGALVKGTLAGIILQARKELLECAFKRKKEELAALQLLTSFDKVQWRRMVLDVAIRAGQTYGATVTGDAGQDRVPNWSEGTPDSAVVDCKILWEKGHVWHYRTIALARSISDRSLVEKTRTLSLKRETDSHMKDADTELSTREVVRDELDTRLRAFESRIAQSMRKQPGKRQASPLTSNRQRKQVRRTSQEKGIPRLEPPSRHEGATKAWQDQGKTVMTTSAFLAQCSKDFRPWLGETFPIVYNSLSLMTRIKIGFALMRTWELETVRTAQPGVFKPANLTLPEDIEYMLSVNHKFILHRAPTRHDVGNAKERFCRTVRTKWHFRNKERGNFIPKFHVPNTYWEPPKASAFIERGLEAAMGVLDAQVHQALLAIAERPAVRKFSNWTRVQEYLEDEGLLVKLTDKNLGLAVFPAKWYDATILQMLADEDTYRIAYNVEDIAFNLRNTLTQELLYLWRLPKQMDQYIRKKTTTQVPEFHAIPKVHKTPWTLRPIVPSHSWVTTTTSEVIDHLCQPLLELFPWVVASSKEVMQKVQKVRPLSSDPLWIMTGDVTAFYTNIPVKQCGRIIAGFWNRYRRTSSIPHSTIRKMIEFVMENNYLRYNGQTFKQIDGLAMGTSCAPVLANLYAAYFEHKAQIVHQDGVLLYVRYIDDILCLFQGTMEAARSFTTKFSLGGLEVRWSVSRSRNEFLDIEFIQGGFPGVNMVETRLFRKTMNRHLYIPWSSAHPLHVKKGFVKAELTRFAMLCSKFEYFADARKEFYGNLRRRGYPAKTLTEWFSTVHYDNRSLFLLSKVKEEEHAPLMLSGHYNPVWDYINVKQVISSARRFWEKEELPDPMKEPLIRSLGRTTSLFDLLSVWNKTTMLSLSEGEPE
jgi:hypothetical protein